jgi:glycosyltransferase involved in cell wall biosynthesis
VPARDATALAAALGEAIARPDLCRAYGAAGRRMVEQEFSLERVIGQMLAVYEELAV